MKTIAQQVKEFGSKVKRIDSGHYRYEGKNISTDFSFWEWDNKHWEIDILGDETSPVVTKYFYSDNFFCTKQELVATLLWLDKQITDGNVTVTITDHVTESGETYQIIQIG